MSKIETPTVKGRKKSPCMMCGKQAKHVTEINGHAICPLCFTDYIVDLIGSRRMKIEKDSSRSKNGQIFAGDEAAVIA